MKRYCNWQSKFLRLFLCLILLLLGSGVTVQAEVVRAPLGQVPKSILVMDLRQGQIVAWLNKTNFHKELGFHLPPLEDEAIQLRALRGFKQNMLNLRKRFHVQYKEYRVQLLKSSIDPEHFAEAKEVAEDALVEIDSQFFSEYHKFNKIRNEALAKKAAATEEAKGNAEESE